MTFWQEFSFGIALMIMGLVLELVIDIYRDRYVRKHDADHRHIS